MMEGKEHRIMMIDCTNNLTCMHSVDAISIILDNSDHKRQ